MFRAIAEKVINENLYLGVRSLCDDEHYEVGDICRESYEWDIENDCSAYYTTGQKAGGTCATYVETQYFETDDEISELAKRIEEAVRKNAEYGGHTQVLIASRYVNNDGYFDPEEIRLIEAEVLAVIRPN